MRSAPRRPSSGRPGQKPAFGSREGFVRRDSEKRRPDIAVCTEKTVFGKTGPEASVRQQGRLCPSGNRKSKARQGLLKKTFIGKTGPEARVREQRRFCPSGNQKWRPRQGLLREEPRREDPDRSRFGSQGAARRPRAGGSRPVHDRIKASSRAARGRERDQVPEEAHRAAGSRGPRR